MNKNTPHRKCSDAGQGRVYWFSVGCGAAGCAGASSAGSPKLGMALERCLNGERPVRPDTSSLLAHFLSAMECRVRLVLINGRKDEVFYARVTIEAANEVMDKLVELDARPSDALMMAVRFGTAIKIVPSVWESMENILPQLEQLDADSPDSRAPVYVGDS